MLMLALPWDAAHGRRGMPGVLKALLIHVHCLRLLSLKFL